MGTLDHSSRSAFVLIWELHKVWRSLAIDSANSWRLLHTLCFSMC
ncbi:unnamed protein product [Staurois parvus]|uniref:Uncharacterized protein n=1 Tax=Staurois parvus TaxID=386267 RepID=A0ABN9DF38_9NEOB|nr:unnamed protein product [Staurois parvus]